MLPSLAIALPVFLVGLVTYISFALAIAFAVVVEQAGHGSATAAPIARQVVEIALRQKLIEAR